MGTETDLIHYFTTMPIIFARALLPLRIDRITAMSRGISGGKTFDFVYSLKTKRWCKMHGSSFVKFYVIIDCCVDIWVPNPN